MTTVESAEPCRGFWADTARVRAGYLAEVPTHTLVLKVAEEVGEVAEAYIGMTGGNPRKGIHKTGTDVFDELADVMLAAAVSMVDLAGGAQQAERHMAERLGIVSARDVAAPPAGAGWGDVEAELADIVITAYVTADLLGIDLEAAWRAKAEIVMTRGWRDTASTDV